jgi:hypothetical protein
VKRNGALPFAGAALLSAACPPVRVLSTASPATRALPWNAAALPSVARARWPTPAPSLAAAGPTLRADRPPLQPLLRAVATAFGDVVISLNITAALVYGAATRLVAGAGSAATAAPAISGAVQSLDTAGCARLAALTNDVRSRRGDVAEMNAFIAS